MIKQLFLTLVISFLFVNISFSQCTPDPNFNGPAIFSQDTMTYLKPAVAEHSYSGYLTIKVPADTVINGFPLPITIDSAGVEDIKDLPSGFTWQTNSNSNFWPGNNKGCLVISGNPTMAQLGDYTFTVEMSAHGFGQVLPIKFRFKIEIIDSMYFGIEELKTKGFEVYQNTPNPFSNQTEIKFFSPINDQINFSVYNIIGEIVYKELIQAKKGDNKIEFSSHNLKSGLYLYQIGNNKSLITRKMVVK